MFVLFVRRHCDLEISASNRPDLILVCTNVRRSRRSCQTLVTWCLLLQPLVHHCKYNVPAHDTSQVSGKKNLRVLSLSWKIILCSSDSRTLAVIHTKSFAPPFVIATPLSFVNQWVEALLHGSSCFVHRVRLLKGVAALVAERGTVRRDVVVGA